MLSNAQHRRHNRAAIDTGYNRPRQSTCARYHPHPAPEPLWAGGGERDRGECGAEIVEAGGTSHKGLHPFGPPFRAALALLRAEWT